MCCARWSRAEKIIFNKISTGALSDLEKVTRQAKAMVSIYGLNDTLGNITYYDSSGQTDFNFSNLIQSKPLKLSIKRFQKLLKNNIIEQLHF